MVNITCQGSTILNVTHRQSPSKINR